MWTRTLKIAAALALLAGPARADAPIEVEVAYVIAAAISEGPFGAWDDVRVAMPRSVNWHLAPPDERNTPIVRRSGWIAQSGRQAGVAVCGTPQTPELLALRVNGVDERVVAQLRAMADVQLQALDPRWAGDTERYTVQTHRHLDQVLERTVRCTPVESRAGRRCDTTYTLTIRPLYRSAPTTRECRAP